MASARSFGASSLVPSSSIGTARHRSIACSLAEHSPPLLPAGAVFPVAVRVEVPVGVQVDKVQPAHAAVGDAGNDAGDVDVAMLKVFERFLVVGRDGQGEHGAVAKDGAGTAS